MEEIDVVITLNASTNLRCTVAGSTWRIKEFIRLTEASIDVLTLFSVFRRVTVLSESVSLEQRVLQSALCKSCTHGIAKVSAWLTPLSCRKKHKRVLRKPDQVLEQLQSVTLHLPGCGSWRGLWGAEVCIRCPYCNACHSVCVIIRIYIYVYTDACACRQTSQCAFFVLHTSVSLKPDNLWGIFWIIKIFLILESRICPVRSVGLASHYGWYRHS